MLMADPAGTLAAAAGALLPPPLAAGRRQPRLCFVAPQAWPVLAGDERIPVVGGAEVQQAILARLLAAAGYPVSMICFDYGQPPLTLVDGVTVIRSHRPDAGVPVLRFVHPRLSGMWRALAAAAADIYYQRSASMLTAVVAAYCRRHGKRSIYAGASDSDFLPGRQMIRFRRDRWLFERGLAMVDAVVVQNERQRRDCLAHYRRDSTLIPSCYPLPAGARPRQGEFILWVGNLGPTKRPERLLEIARLLPHRRFVLIGGGEGLAALRAAAGPLANVELTGFLPLSEAEAWFDGAQLVVNTSVFEGMPNVFLQAWARGVPTLAFADTGARLHGKPVYPVVGTVAEAAAEIEHLLTDDLHRARTAARCREYFTQTHGSAGVLARTVAVLDELAGRKG